MGKMSYGEQLAHPNWQRKRLEILEAAEWTCSSCGETEKTLHVHHKRYVKGRMAWEYEADELAALCKSCHAAEHETEIAMSEVERNLARIHGDGHVRALLAGYAVACGCHPDDGDLAAHAFMSDPLAYSYGGILALLGALNSAHPATGRRAVQALLTSILRIDAPEMLDAWHERCLTVLSSAFITPEARAAAEALSAYIAALNADRAANPRRWFE